MYLGLDALTIAPNKTDAGAMVRVHRPSGPLPGGRLLDKRAVQKAFEVKIAAAEEADPDIIAGQDWTGVQAIIQAIVTAFD